MTRPGPGSAGGESASSSSSAIGRSLATALHVAGGGWYARPMSEKVEQALYWPQKMLEDIRVQAARLDTSLSWCVQRAWKLGRKTIVALPAEGGVDDTPGSPGQVAEAAVEARYGEDGPKQKQTLFFPEEMLAEIRAEAQRMDRSLSWVVQRAWAVAYPEIAALPPRQDD
jgi:uncharacterized small protein (TIGR04563 family)